MSSTVRVVLSKMSVFSSFFFFQAEDGIRDYKVTGVQTCALPISITIPVATQLPHAVGLAYAAQYRGDDVVVMAYFGDGATSEGDFHEALNFAGVWHVPV